MNRKRLTAIAILAAVLYALWRIASRPPATIPARDTILMRFDEDGAYALGYTQGLNGIPGYWYEYERTEFDRVPGVGVVWRASPEERAYWRGWHDGEAERDQPNS